MSDQVMIDIETLSSASNAAIVSIGACMFDMTKGADYADPEDSFLVGIDPEYYPTICPGEFDISARTCKWWSQQSDAARASLMINQMITRTNKLAAARPILRFAFIFQFLALSVFNKIFSSRQQ